MIKINEETEYNLIIWTHQIVKLSPDNRGYTVSHKCCYVENVP